MFGSLPYIRNRRCSSADRDYALLAWLWELSLATAYADVNLILLMRIHLVFVVFVQLFPLTAMGSSRSSYVSS